MIPDPVEAEGIGTDWDSEAHALGEFQQVPGTEECPSRTTDRDEPVQRAEAIARPLLGGSAPCATPRTDDGDRLPIY